MRDDVKEAEIKEADAKSAYIKDADVGKADTKDADVKKADIKDADVKKADTNAADVKGVKYTDRERLELKKYSLLSGSILKVMAVVFMLIDHIAAYVLVYYPKALEPVITIGSHTLSVYNIMRKMGRISFPIFCFLLVEGFMHTGNRCKYGRNLIIFALISEIPWNLVHSGSFFYSGQNVFFTLFLGYLGLCAIEKYSEDRAKQIGCLVLLMIAALVFNADYGMRGFGFIIMLYALRGTTIIRGVVGSCMLPSYFAGIAFVPIAMYNGKRGFIKGKGAKYMFYAIYPIHMFILYAVRYMYMV